MATYAHAARADYQLDTRAAHANTAAWLSSRAPHAVSALHRVRFDRLIADDAHSIFFFFFGVFFPLF